jgi:hypothetical protein
MYTKGYQCPLPLFSLALELFIPASVRIDHLIFGLCTYPICPPFSESRVFGLAKRKQTR